MDAETKLMEQINLEAEKLEENSDVEIIDPEVNGDLPSYEAVEVDEPEEEQDDVVEDEPEEEVETSVEDEPETPDEEDGPKDIPELRNAYKDLKRREREAQEQLQQLQAQYQQQVQPQVLQNPPRSIKATAGELLEGFAKAKAGEIDLDEQKMQNLVYYIGELSGAELAEAHQQAMLGQFGDYSEDVVQLAAQQLPAAGHRVQARMEKYNQDQTKQQIRDQALVELSQIEGIDDPESPYRKKFDSAYAAYVGYMGQEDFEKIPAMPKMVAELVELRDLASRTIVAEKKAAEYETRFARFLSPASGGTGKPGKSTRHGGTRVERAKDALVQKLAEAGNPHV